MQLYVMTARLKRAKQTIGAVGVHPDVPTAQASMHAEVLTWLTEHRPDAIERSLEITAAPLNDDEVVTILMQLALARPDLFDRATAAMDLSLESERPL